jgi:hypothetical protein
VRLTLTRRVAIGLAAAILAAGPGVALPVTTRAAGKPASTAPALPVGPLTPPISPAVPTQTQTQPPIVVNTTASGGGGGGISSGTALGIAVAAFVIIAGIVIAVMRDARSKLTKRPTHTEERIPGSKRAPKARKLSASERKRRKRGRAPRRR